ncbi:DNA modification methylase [Haloechinothrix sp. YIM 98757]|uniref:DNA modification methylase n=1 Tax=Haloechinothrix aidingensis TaxID=2752311 RepID=A0A838ADU2_9PSEU|nr:DNA modification methylase [Haloechinothrix aidingensis]MBA0127298.1 DNA modification methylase [Haloechinothrix aidingensis]
MPKNVVCPASVWATGQRSPRQHIADRLVGATRSETALTPAIAGWIIETYTDPGAIVCDPNPGPGLVLAEAVRAGRHALALATQPRWESALEANLDLARLAGSAGHATLLDSIDDPRAADLPGAVDLMLTGLRHTPTSEPSRVLVGLYEDLTAVADWVWPGGHIVITCRPWRRRGRLLDLPGKIHDAAEAVGLVPADHCIALTAPMHGHQLRPRHISRTGHRPESTDLHGQPTAHPTHIDVLIFRAPTTAPDPNTTTTEVA